MLSKQDKLKYGQMLRLQMKQKEEKKKMQQLQKRGIKKSPTDGYLLIQKQNNTLADQKQYLQKRLQTEDYMPFGKPGAGAPTKIQGGGNSYQANRQRTEIYGTAQNVAHPVYGQPQQPRRQATQNYNTGSYNETHEQGNRNHIYPPTGSYIYEPQQNYPYPQAHHSSNSYQQVHSIPPPQYDLNAKYQPSQYYNQQKQQGQFNINYAYQQPQNTQAYNQYNQNQHSYPQAVNRFEPNVPSYQPQRQWDNFNNSRPPADLYQKPMDQITRNQQNNRQTTLQNQQTMEVYRKGGRNLLKLQNQTAQEINVKQKQKLQMQKYLKLQIQEAERKKRQQKQRLKQQELEQQRKNKEYLQRQNQKIKDDEQKQIDKKRKIQQQNENNLKIKKQMQQDARRAQQAKQNRTGRNNLNQAPPPPQQYHQQPQVFTKQVQHRTPIEEQSQSVSSNSIMIEQAFNTDVSKEFFRRERQRDPQKNKQDRKIQVFTEQLQKMRDEISNQGVVFEKQINKVKMEAEAALQEKRRADREIQKLKQQLKKKMQDDNQKLFEALNRNAKTNSYDSPPQQYKKKGTHQNRNQENPRARPPLRPKKQQKLVDRVYQPPEQLEQFGQTNQFLKQTNQFQGLGSFVGNSKKIPLNLKTNKDLSMSQLSQFARQTGFFKQKKESPKKSYPKNIKQSIVQQDEERFGSRGGSRVSQKQNNYNKNSYNYGHNQKDQLDRLIDSRQKSRGGWGELSSVNSDITKEIEDLLKKKGNPTNQRPRSRKLQSAGKQSLANYNHGIVYDGGTINTLNSGGTLDIDRIQGRNDERLRQLKNLGVETINTNDDGDLNRLDVLLKKYAN